MKSSLFFKQAAGTFFFFAIIFLCAGRILYWPGLVYVLIGLIMLTLNYTVLRLDPGLLAERSGPKPGTKNWDKWILGFSFLAMVAMYVVAGLDSGRFHWSPDFHIGLFIAGIVLTASGQLLFLVAQKQNRFFSSTVRIQANREHKVCDTGLYKFVRHPAYLGNVIQVIGFPLLFGSLWSIIPAGLSLILVLIRTFLEDKTLQKELSGYTEYSAKVRFKIIPYIW
jgi:protein-S-isoprenylcysteine O-methyltransferase Ste14